MHFKSSQKIDVILSDFQKNAVPYFPSPLKSVATDVLTPSFIDWFKAKVETLANRVKSSEQSSSIFATTIASPSESHMEVAEHDDDENNEDENYLCNR